MTQAADVRATLARIEEAQAALHDMLRGVKPARLRERAPSGEWSPMEQVRHLVFAEQHHFGPYLVKGFRWNSVGVPPPNRTGERRLSPVGSDPGTTLDEVFEAWTKVHAVVRALALEKPNEVAKTLEGNLSHVGIHTETIRRSLAS